MSGIARHHSRPLLYVNQVGGNDSLVFDGRSCAFDADGNICRRSGAAGPAAKAAALLLEFKCPYRRQPRGDVPIQYQPQVLSGLALSPPTSAALFVDAVFRKAPIGAFDWGPFFDFDYHRERTARGAPVALGLVAFYAPRLDAEDLCRRLARRASAKADGYGEDPAQDLWLLYRREMGLPPGPVYREILGALRGARLDGEIETLEQERALVQEMVEGL